MRLSRKVKLSILDIGAADGTFVKLASDSGWESYGLEPSQSEVEKITDPSLRQKIIIGSAENIPFSFLLF